MGQLPETAAARRALKVAEIKALWGVFHTLDRDASGGIRREEVPRCQPAPGIATVPTAWPCAIWQLLKLPHLQYNVLGQRVLSSDVMRIRVQQLEEEQLKLEAATQVAEDAASQAAADKQALLTRLRYAENFSRGSPSNPRSASNNTFSPDEEPVIDP